MARGSRTVLPVFPVLTLSFISLQSRLRVLLIRRNKVEPFYPFVARASYNLLEKILFCPASSSNQFHLPKVFINLHQTDGHLCLKIDVLPNDNIPIFISQRATGSSKSPVDIKAGSRNYSRTNIACRGEDPKVLFWVIFRNWAPNDVVFHLFSLPLIPQQFLSRASRIYIVTSESYKKREWRKKKKLNWGIFQRITKTVSSTVEIRLCHNISLFSRVN